MPIRVEFYGIPRARAGVASTEIITSTTSVTLGYILRELARRYPQWGAECLDGERLKAGYVANVGGERFVSQPQTSLAADACLLILSADAGG